MKEISEASLQVERSKVDVQVKLFADQMAYQRDRDFRLHETAQMSILKQHEMVQCFRELTAVLGAGLAAGNPTNAHTVHPPIPAGSSLRSPSMPVYSACAFPAGATAVETGQQELQSMGPAAAGEEPGIPGQQRDNNVYCAGGPSSTMP